MLPPSYPSFCFSEVDEDFLQIVADADTTPPLLLAVHSFSLPGASPLLLPPLSL